MNLEAVSELLQALEGSRVAELKLDGPNGVGLRVRRAIRSASPPATQAVGTASDPAESVLHALPEPPPVTVVESRFVGRFRGPREPLTAGDRVQEAQVLGAIESVGLMNRIAAPISGIITSAHVGEGETVEFGQPLYDIAPS